MYAPVGSAAMDTDEYLMGKPKEADKDDDELKKVKDFLIADSIPLLVLLVPFVLLGQNALLDVGGEARNTGGFASGIAE
jgi:hypothetical protein